MFENSSFFTKIFMIAFIVISCFLIIFVIGLVLAIPIFDLNIFTDPSILDSENLKKNVDFLKYLQILQSVGLFVLPPFIIAFLFSYKIKNYLKLDTGISPSFFIIAVIVMISGLPIIEFLARINSFLELPEFMSGIENWMKNAEEKAAELTAIFLQTKGFNDLLVNLLMIAIIPAIGEELLFRGVVQKVFIDLTKNIHWGIFISAFIFSAGHFQFYGFLPRLALGMFFGYLLDWSGSIWLPIIAHFVQNAMAVFFYHFFADKFSEEEIFELSENYIDSNLLLILSFLVLISGIFIIRMINRRKVQV